MAENEINNRGSKSSIDYVDAEEDHNALKYLNAATLKVFSSAPLLSNSSSGGLGLGDSDHEIVYPGRHSASHSRNHSRGNHSDFFFHNYHALKTDEIIEKEHPWRFPMSHFRTCQQKWQEAPQAQMSKDVKKFYKKQDALIEQYDQIYTDIINPAEEDKNTAKDENLAKLLMSERLAKLSFALNFVTLILTIAKIVAFGLSGSLSIVSSVVDSAIDLLSGIIIWLTNRAVRKRNPYFYPQGRTRLEPVAIIILAVILSVSTMQVMIFAIEQIVKLAKETTTVPSGIKWPVIGLIGFVIVTKLILYFVCKKLGSTASSEALAQDHRNDVLSNVVVIVMTILSDKVWVFFDPIGAILLALYILCSWIRTVKEHVRQLTGYTADPEFLKQVTFIALNHHSQIQQIDTVRGYFFGVNYLVEVDIVLPEDMTLREAHDIGEALQHKIEKLPDVERAFVHLDYEYTHDPRSEHKQV